MSATGISLSSELAIESRIASLMAAPLGVVRAAWREVHPTHVLPRGLPRDLMVRSIAWELQATEQGGHGREVVKKLERMAAQLALHGRLDIEREVRLKPGTRLVREWRGRTYTVETDEHGFTLDGKAYASLSHVARAITGTRWSGPRFFGIKTASRDGAGEA